MTVFRAYNPNCIIDVAIKPRHRSELPGVYTEMYTWSKSREFKPKIHRMDNEKPGNVGEVDRSKNMGIT